MVYRYLDSETIFVFLRVSMLLLHVAPSSAHGLSVVVGIPTWSYNH